MIYDAVLAEFDRCFAEVLPSSILRKRRNKKDPRGVWTKAAWTYEASKGKKTGRLAGPHLDWLAALGLRYTNSHNKQIPEQVYSSGPAVIAACLAGLVSTDGSCRSFEGGAQYYTRSRELAHGVRGLYLRLGIPSSVRERDIKGAPFFVVSVVTLTGRQRFQELIFPRLCHTGVTPWKTSGQASTAFSLPPEVVERLSELGCPGLSAWIRGRNRLGFERFMRSVESIGGANRLGPMRQFASPDVGWDQVSSISSRGSLQTFDVQTPSEAFVASDFIVHNSSLLDAIESALGGRSRQPEHPIHTGERSAVVVADLGGKFRVKRTWTPKNTYLTVERIEAGGLVPIAKPQEFLDSICGSGIGFDPLEFSRKKPAEQVQMILGTLTVPQDLGALDAQRKALYDQRTKINREVADADARLRSFPAIPAATPDEPVTLTALAEEFQRQQAILRVNVERRRELGASLQWVIDRRADRQRELGEAKAKIERLRTQLEDAESELASLEIVIPEMDEEDEVQEGNYRQEIAALVDPDVAEIQHRMGEIEQTNALVLQKKHRQALGVSLHSFQATADDLSEKIAAIDQQKTEILTQAAFPHPDLAIAETNGSYGVTYRGIPFTDCSSSEKLRISCALARSLNPTVRVILVREGNLLDEPSRATLDAWAKENDLQVWLELCTTDREAGGFLIEDGSLVEEP